MTDVVWFVSGWATGLITFPVVYYGLRYVYKWAVVWPQNPKEPPEDGL